MKKIKILLIISLMILIQTGWASITVKKEKNLVNPFIKTKTKKTFIRKRWRVKHKRSYRKLRFKKKSKPVKKIVFKAEQINKPFIKKLKAVIKKSEKQKPEMLKTLKRKKVLTDKPQKNRKKNLLIKQQDYEKLEVKTFYLGIKGGINLTATNVEKKRETGLDIGAAFELTLFTIPGIKLAAALELNLNYVKKEVSISEGKIYTAYFNTPLLLKAKWIFNPVNPFISAGLSPFFHLNSYFNYAANDTDYKMSSAKFHLAFVCNAGLDFDLGPLGTFSAEFRLSIGLTNAIKNQDAYFRNYGFEDVHIAAQKYNSYVVMLGWKIALEDL